MKKKIAILGSTGSIGKSLIEIIKKNKNQFEIVLLTANKNDKLLLQQAKSLNVKNIIISEKSKYQNIVNKIKNIKVYNNFNNLNKIFKTKIDYIMSAITGIDGLEPTYLSIKHTKKIAIANKESIICAWNLIKKELKKNKTEFIPVDSEHFSIWYALKKNSIDNLDKIYLTASGGPLLNVSKKKFNKLKISEITKHPNWKMGAKISGDSATMINKVFEVIEAKKIFNIKYNKLSIFIHPNSYVHAILKFKDGMINLIAHDTTMEIPIFNTLDRLDIKKIKIKKINLTKLNNLNLSKLNPNKFPLSRIIKKLPLNGSLFETVLVSSNDELVKLFLKKKFTYSTLLVKLFKFVTKKEFIKYKFIEPKKIIDILNLNKEIKSKIKQIYF